MVFAVVSLAICGIGMGGFGVHALARRRPGLLSSSWFLFSLPSLFSVSIVLVIVVIFALPLRNDWLFYMILSLLPFLFAGVFLALIFKSHPGGGCRVYFACL